MPCKVETECKCRNLPFKQRILCANWYPSRASKYYNCELYELEQIPCPFTNRKCSECQHYSKLERKGRPNTTGIDWDDPEQVNEYRRSIYRERHSNTEQVRDQVPGEGG